jgi:cell division transport system permease protein
MVGIILRLFGRGVRDMAAHPLAQVFTLLAVTLAVFLAGLFLMAFVNLDQALGTARGKAVYQVYWHADADMKTVRSQWDSFGHMPWLTEVKTYTPEEALETLSGNLSSVGGVDTSWIDKSPLPPTAVLVFEPKAKDMSGWHDETMTYLSGLPGVQRIGASPVRDDLARAWNVFSRNVMWPVIGFLGLVLSLVVGNTIKLSLVSRETEIEILHLVGARNWYIRLPLLITGGIQGLCGGLLATGLLWVTWMQIRNVFMFPPVSMQLSFLPVEQVAMLVAVPAVMGVVSSWIAVKR